MSLDPSAAMPPPVMPVYPGVIPGLGLLPPQAYGGGGAQSGAQPQQQGAAGGGQPGQPLAPIQNQRLPSTSSALTPGLGAAAMGLPRPRPGFPLANIGAAAMQGQAPGAGAY